MKPPANRWSTTTIYRRSRNESAVRRESEPERMARKPPSSSLSIVARTGESSEADRALYAAKTSGHDRSVYRSTAPKQADGR